MTKNGSIKDGLGIPILLGLMFWSWGCALSDWNAKKDPFYSSFYEKAQLIMLDAEKKTYRQLPDTESKQKFIEEFWKIRDPDTGTSVNENQEEFQDRIEYANIWFGTFNPRRGHEAVPGRESSTGWNSERGRIYVILGPPDELFYDGMDLMLDGRRISRSQGQRTEIWYYYTYDVAVYFVKSRSGRWSLANPDPALFDALDRAKKSWIREGFLFDTDKRFEFSLSYEGDHLLIKIPVEHISFIEKEERLRAEFKVRIDIHLDDVEVDTIEDTHPYEISEQELLKLDEVSLQIPYTLLPEGTYRFDVTVEDALALSPMRSNKTLDIKRVEIR